jgi:hypothetical protein
MDRNVNEEVVDPLTVAELNTVFTQGHGKWPHVK